MNNPVELVSEFDLIKEIFTPLSNGDSRALNLGDDGAILPQIGGWDTVISTDTMVENIHFLMSEKPCEIAERLLRVNLSDLAAMGAEPLGYFLNISLASSIDKKWLKTFSSGLGAGQREFNISLLGGDTTRTGGSLTLSVTILGQTPSGAAIKRIGAQVGDRVFVSGTIGDAGVGLARFKKGTFKKDPTIERFQKPIPRISLGLLLRGIANSMVDVSDGLIADIQHICSVSKVDIDVFVDKVPLSTNVRKALADGETSLEKILTSGEDYELVFTAPEIKVPEVLKAGRTAEVKIKDIGRVEKGSGKVRARDVAGNEIPFIKRGYEHF